MAAIPGTPSNFAVQSGNQQILVSWSQSAGATSYIVERSLDNVTFTTVSTISGSPLATQYLDTSVSLGVQYWYQVAAANDNGTSAYTTSASAIPTISGEMALAQIRLAAKQRADRVNSQFVTDSEWNSYINQSMFELYDLLVSLDEDYFVTTPVQFTCNGSQFIYPLPDGLTSFQSGLQPSTTLIPRPFYKLKGVDLALNNAANAFVTVSRFNFSDRNNFVYPNTASTIYGVFNLRYRIVGTSSIEFIPTPSGNQQIRLWYIPRLKQLLLDTDTTDLSISGWIEYVIAKAAYYALTKEESDTTPLMLQLQSLKLRIEEAAANRDQGIPNTISETRRGPWSNGWSGNNSGPIGGF